MIKRNTADIIKTNTDGELCIANIMIYLKNKQIYVKTKFL